MNRHTLWQYSYKIKTGKNDVKKKVLATHCSRAHFTFWQPKQSYSHYVASISSFCRLLHLKDLVRPGSSRIASTLAGSVLPGQGCAGFTLLKQTKFWSQYRKGGSCPYFWHKMRCPWMTKCRGWTSGNNYIRLWTLKSGKKQIFGSQELAHQASRRSKGLQVLLLFFQLMGFVLTVGPHFRMPVLEAWLSGLEFQSFCCKNSASWCLNCFFRTLLQRGL